MRTNRQPEGLRIPSSITDEAEIEIEQYLRNEAWLQIICGHGSVDAFVEQITDDDESVTAEQAAAAFAYVRAARVAQQADWTDAPTNLTRAFDALAGIGILARQNFSCCGNCASRDIWDELDDSRTWRGYIYFHAQDTEGLVEDQSTYIGYGVFVPAYVSQHGWEAMSDEDQKRRYAELTTGLMDEAKEILTAEGIGWEWNGDLGTRILLTNAEYFAHLS